MFDLSGKTALVQAQVGDWCGNCKCTHLRGASSFMVPERKSWLRCRQNLVKAYTVTADLGNREEVAEIIGEAIQKAGPISILVNNAGITRDNLAMRMKDEEWEKVLDINLTASMILCRCAMRGMMKARHGRIISISSIVGFTGNPGQTNYAASKAGMIGFSKSLAQEVANRGVTVNIVAPGFIETPMTDVLSDEQKTLLLGRVPAARLGQADEIAAAVAYLASDEAAYVTGATIHVNVGMAML